MTNGLKPIASPLELRDATVRDYTRAARRIGLEPDVEAIARLAQADLTLVDAYEREVKRSPAPAAPRQRARPRQSALEKAQQEQGVKVVQDHATRDRPHVLYAKAHMVSQRWSHATARIARILQGVTASSDISQSLQDAVAPKLAKEFAELYIHFQLRGRQSKHNPFRGLSARDAARMFVRKVEDICDRSTGIPGLGPWWVK